ncbi:unnamed protein product, partial [Sphacelaria rigidula]
QAREITEQIDGSFAATRYSSVFRSVRSAAVHARVLGLVRNGEQVNHTVTDRFLWIGHNITVLIAGFPQKWADNEFLANGNYTEVKYTRVRQKGYRLSNSILGPRASRPPS